MAQGCLSQCTHQGCSIRAQPAPQTACQRASPSSLPCEPPPLLPMPLALGRVWEWGRVEGCFCPLVLRARSILVHSCSPPLAPTALHPLQGDPAAAAGAVLTPDTSAIPPWYCCYDDLQKPDLRSSKPSWEVNPTQYWLHYLLYIPKYTRRNSHSAAKQFSATLTCL